MFIFSEGDGTGNAHHPKTVRTLSYVQNTVKRIFICISDHVLENNILVVISFHF
jgi:hypothetical protein